MRTTALSLALFAACRAQDAPAPTDPPVEAAPDTASTEGRGVDGELRTEDGEMHQWHAWIPAGDPPASGRPVLVWLHGDGGSGEGFGAAFRPVLAPDGAVLVTPDGVGRTWTHAVGNQPGQPQDSQFLAGLIEAVIEDGIDGEPADATRIYVGGVSRGAYMPYYLLQRGDVADRIAAVAVDAGLLYCLDGDAACEAEASDPVAHGADAAVLHIHGTDDAVVGPPPTARFHDPVDWDVDWRVFSPMNLWAAQHGCFGGDNATGKDDGRVVERFEVRGHPATTYDLTGWGPACARYQLTLVEGGGHVIGGMEERIWSFLRAHGG